MPGCKSDHVPVEIDEHGRKAAREVGDTEQVEYGPVQLEEDVDRKKGKTDKSKIYDIRVSTKDIERFGATPACPVCRGIMDKDKVPPGVSHSVECRSRIRENPQEDDDIQSCADESERREGRRIIHYGKNTGE